MKRNLPLLPAAQSRAGISFDLPQAALALWNPAIQAAAGDTQSISIFDPIGYDAWTGDGVTAKRIGAALRGMACADVTVTHLTSSTVYVHGAVGKIDRATHARALNMLRELGVTTVMYERRGQMKTIELP